MSSLPNKMGEADSTTNVGNAGLRLFHYYHKKNFKPFIEDTTEEYVEEDNIKVLFIDYSNWLATTAIPKHFDEDLKSNSTLNINANTLKNDLSKVILMLKDNIPKHCAWEETEWITRMSGDEFEKKCKPEQGRGNVDVSEDTKHGLYSKASPWLNAIDEHWMSKIDLEQVNLILMKTAEHGSTYRPLQKRAMINFNK